MSFASLSSFRVQVECLAPHTEFDSAAAAATSSIPQGRSSTATGIIGDYLYVFSGEHAPRVPADNSLFAFYIPSRKWTRVTLRSSSSPCGRVGHAGVAAGGKFYVYGGRTEYDGEKTMNDMWCFTPDAKEQTTGEWHQIKPHNVGAVWPPPLSYHTMSAASPALLTSSEPSSFYIFGGCLPSNRSNELYHFHADTQTFELLSFIDTKNAPCNRGGPSLSVIPSLVVVAVSFGYNGHNELADSSAFNLHTREWTALETSSSSEAVTARSVTDTVFLSGVGKQGAIFVFGGEWTPSVNGHEGAGEYHDDAYLYDIANKTWHRVYASQAKASTSESSSSAESTTGPVARGWFNSMSYGGDGKSVVVFGGFDGVRRRNDVWVFRFVVA